MKNKEKKLIPFFLLSIFPILYSITIVIIYQINDEDLYQFFGYIFAFFTFPTNFIVIFILDLFKFYDPYSFFESGIGGTIQYGLLLLFIYSYLKKKEKDNIL